MAEQLLREAEAFHRKGDVYTAVKLFKKVIRLAPDWVEPYLKLSVLYKDRADWKTCLHYTHMSLQFDPESIQAWTNLGLAYTAQKKWKAARQAWNQLGYGFRETDRSTDFDLGTVALCLNPRTQPEVVWARQLDPARAVVLSIPQPGTGHRYLDTILFDPSAPGAQVLGARKRPAYNELQILRSSPFKTFTVELLDVTEGQIDTLARLCGDEGVGFDNWSAATHLFLPPGNREQPEFHLHPFPKEAGPRLATVALAAKTQRPLQQILKNWEIISLCPYRNLQLVY